MPSYVNVPDFLKIGAMAFAFVWGLNKLLDKANLGQFKA